MEKCRGCRFLGVSDDGDGNYSNICECEGGCYKEVQDE